MPGDVIIGAGQRTPLGNFGGALRDVPLANQAAHAIRASLTAAAVDPGDVDHCVFSTTVPTDRDSLFAARVVAMRAGLPETAPALCVTRACASGLQAILSAAQQIADGQSRLSVVAGAEAFSRVPHVVSDLRWNAARGGRVFEDMLDWAYRCPFSQEYMGDTAETLADRHGYSRAAMDEWAAMSQARALGSRWFLARQIAPMPMLAEDESPREDAVLTKLASLRPAFRDGGRVTAGNASGVTDGAAAMIACAPGTTTPANAFRVKAWKAVGVPPEIMGIGPVPAVRAVLAETGMGIGDIDYFEVNEAFAVVNLHAEAELGIPRDRHNLYGGGISLGHPPAVTGLRMAMTAAQHLHETDGTFAMLTMCLGGGQGMAMLIERV
ncbi:thiolase family protein [Anianabacter salinae]|uniref:thiolase family protein n=1 Tax=Anianabacter salinae TaxID=2851023 RepID=UPI00225E422D|nr:thiolase family protein [Anianabacter salinae]MBV0911038.1 thiolase family protein [Anianabacter salinae]